jgi:hypothetical protein
MEAAPMTRIGDEQTSLTSPTVPNTAEESKETLPKF